MRREESGVTLVLFALLLVALSVLVAFVVDLGPVYTERRQDQSGADGAALAGAQAVRAGQSLSGAVMAVARANLRTQYSDAQWTTLWQGCTDPARPAAYVVTAASPCISFSPSFGRVRVRVPDQLLPANFSRVIGVSLLKASAVAEAGAALPGQAGILPFPANVSFAGPEICLKTQTNGQAQAPCDGSHGGNFGYLDSPWFGNPALGTTQNCTTQQKTVITNDIAVGLDHVVVPIGATARRDDTCPYTLETPPDHMFTQTGGTPNAFLDPPMVSGSSFSDGRPARLQRVPGGSWPTRTVGGNRLDDQPLWSFIDPNLTAPTIPASCQRTSFNGAGATKAHMAQCLTDYRVSVLAFPGTPALFTVASKPPRCTGASYDIQCSARFAFVPQSKQDLTLCTGNCDFDVLGFLPVFVQSAYFDCNGGSCDQFDPGLSFSGKGKTLDAISGFVFDSVTQQALPRAVVSPGPGGPLTGLPPALVQ